MSDGVRTVFATFRISFKRGTPNVTFFALDARKVEGVQRHLGRGLAHGLGREHAAHLAAWALACTNLASTSPTSLRVSCVDGVVVAV